jgi:hypothetical protein
MNQERRVWFQLNIGTRETHWHCCSESDKFKTSQRRNFRGLNDCCVNKQESDVEQSGKGS